jgi:hypothetical protein
MAYSLTVIALLLYRASIVAAAFGCIFMGYRLFCRGMFDPDRIRSRRQKTGDAQAAGEIAISLWKDGKLTLKRATPGAIFAAFGGFVLCVSIFKGVHMGFKAEEHLDTLAAAQDTPKDFVAFVQLPEEKVPVEHAKAAAEIGKVLATEEKKATEDKKKNPLPAPIVQALKQAQAILQKPVKQDRKVEIMLQGIHQVKK